MPRLDQYSVISRPERAATSQYINSFEQGCLSRSVAACKDIDPRVKGDLRMLDTTEILGSKFR